MGSVLSRGVSVATDMFNPSTWEQEALDVPVDPDDVFKDVITRNGNVCQCCYRRLWATDLFPATIGERHHGLMVSVDRHEDPDDAVYYTEQMRVEGRTGTLYTDDGVSEHRTSYCEACGSTSPRRSPGTTRSVSEKLVAAEGISETLGEYGIEHDADELYATVEELAREPEWAGDDFGVFQRATEAAILAVPWKEMYSALSGSDCA